MPVYHYYTTAKWWQC